ncbi:MAG: hypothetical protein ACK55I_47230, partial [bacterium]
HLEINKKCHVQNVYNNLEKKSTAIADTRSIRTTALAARVTTYTTIAGAQAAVEGIRHLLDASLTVIDVQAMHRQIAESKRL